MVWGLGFGVWGLGFSGSRVSGFRFRVLGFSGSRVLGFSGSRVWGFGFTQPVLRRGGTLEELHLPFRGLVFKAQTLVSLNSRLESNKEEEEPCRSVRFRVRVQGLEVGVQLFGIRV